MTPQYNKRYLLISSVSRSFYAVHRETSFPKLRKCLHSARRCFRHLAVTGLVFWTLTLGHRKQDCDSMAQPLNGKADLTLAQVPRQPHGPLAFLPSLPFALPSVTASSHPAPAVPCMCQELLCPSFPSSWRPRPWSATRRRAGSVPRATSCLARGLCHELTGGLWKRGVCVCACMWRSPGAWGPQES